MRAITRNHRAARVALALLGGLLVGGWIGGGLVWILNRNKFKDPNTVGDVALAKANELDLVPADAAGFAHARLADIWRTEAFAEFRKVLEKAGPDAIKAFDEGFVPAPSSIDRATLVVIQAPVTTRPIVTPKKAGNVLTVPPPPPLPKPGEKAPLKTPVRTEPAPIVILAFASPFNESQVLDANFPNAVAEEAGAKKFHVNQKNDMAVHFHSDRVMILGSGAALSTYLSLELAKEGPLSGAIKLAASGNRHIVAGVSMNQLPTGLPIGIPEEIRPVLRAESLTVGIVLGNGAKFDVRAAYKDEAAAQSAEKALRSAAAEGRKKLTEMKARLERTAKGDPDAKKVRSFEELPGAAASLFGLGALNTFDEWLADPPLVVEGKEVSATVTLSSMGNAYMGVAAMSVGMLLPAVEKVREAATRTAGSDNLHQIAIAFHAYHDANSRFPEQSWGNKIVNGRQTGNLSWRVAILPYIEQDVLYRQFKHDEPWDSENNKKLIPMMPKTYASPMMPAEAGKTYYKVFVGGGAIFDRPFNRFTIANIPDGSSNTILVAEGGDPVIWTKPDDFEFDPKKPLPKIGLPGKPGFNVAMADGSVRFISASEPETTLKLRIQADDGQVLPEPPGGGPAFPGLPFPNLNEDAFPKTTVEPVNPKARPDPLTPPKAKLDPIPPPKPK